MFFISLLHKARFELASFSLRKVQPDLDEGERLYLRPLVRVNCISILVVLLTVSSIYCFRAPLVPTRSVVIDTFGQKGQNSPRLVANAT